jgi:two-component system chemotaxis response regulator CheB
MEQSGSPSNNMIVGDCLRRVAEEPEEFCEKKDSPLENLIVIGSSAGGHAALKEVVRGLSYDIPAPIIITQHMPATGATRVSSFKLEQWLRNFTQVPTQVVQAGDRLQGGRMYIVPPGRAASLDGRTLHLAPQMQALPVTTINYLFESAAQTYRERVIGVILTGFLRDGTAGLKAVHEAGGLTIVQDPSEAEYPEMPANAMQDLPVTFCLGLRDIGPALDMLARRQTTLESGLALSVRMLKQRSELLMRLLAQSKKSQTTSRFLSTEILVLEEDLRTVQALLNEALALTSNLKGRVPRQTPL